MTDERHGGALVPMDESAGSALGTLPRSSAGLSAGRRWTGLAVAVLGLPTLTAVLDTVGDGLSLGSVLLLYLLMVVITAGIGGLGPGALAVVASVFAANWYFTPPFHTLAVESRDSIVELVVFALVALVVSLAVDLAARDRGRAERSGLEATLLARFAARPAAELSLTEVLESVRSTFGMTSATLVRASRSRQGDHGVVASVGPLVDEPPSIRVPAGDELTLLAHGPTLFAEDRQLLERLAAAAARAWEAQHLAAQADELAGIDRARSALLAAVGHDLRTPLTGLKAAVSSLRQDDVTFEPAEQDAFLATIEEAADRLTDLIANLLDMSRLQAGSIVVQDSPVAVDEVVSRVLLGSASDGLVMDVPDDLPLVRADPGLLERVLANLVDNAHRHSHADRSVVLTARSVPGPAGTAAGTGAPGLVRVQVTDHGQGVPPAGWTTMFLPFQRLDDRTASAGVGLGLAIVKGFCDAMGIDVTPSLTPGGGLTMTLDIPVAQP